MPNYSDSRQYPNIGDTLAAQGPGWRIGEFDQTVFNKWTKETQGKSLGEGYCAGVVTDWLRRVLLAGKKGYREDRGFLTYNYKDMNQAQVMLKAQRTVQRMGHAWVEGGKMSWNAGPGNDDSHLIANPEYWQEAAENIDLRTGKGKKKGETRRSYSDLQLVSGMSKTYETCEEWLAAIVGGATGASPIEPGCGAKLGFGRPGQTGHAVAVWRRRTATGLPDSYYFFDPNLGVFSFNQSGLESALTILFATPRHGNDIPYYKTCSAADGTRMSYLVFGPAHKMDATPQRMRDEQPPEVVTTQAPTTQAPTQQAPVPTPQVTSQQQQPARQPPVQTTQAQPQRAPVNVYAQPSTGLGTPGNVTSVPRSRTEPSGDLKSQLQAANEDEKRYTYAFKGKQGGYVKLDPALAAQIKEKAPGIYKQKGFVWNAESVVEQPAGQFKHAILKTTLEKLINWM